MKISLYGLAFAGLFLAAALVQWFFLKKALARGLESEQASLSPAQIVERKASHEKLTTSVFWFDLLVMPPVGYFVGNAIFGN